MKIGNSIVRKDIRNTLNNYVYKLVEDSFDTRKSGYDLAWVIRSSVVEQLQSIILYKSRWI